MKKRNNKISITVIVCTYNQSIVKLRNTLNSIIVQEYNDLDIIIADDCSSQDHFDWIRQFMKDNKFEKYRLIKNKYNLGTVNNFYKALNFANGYIIKLISPGDMFLCDNTLSEWAEKFIKSQKKWSFCDYIVYENKESQYDLVKMKHHPQVMNVYKNNNLRSCQWNYTVFNDIALGASILAYRDVLIEYLSKINNFVKFAEDNIFRIMMANSVFPYYYDEISLLYENGSGISTSNNQSWQDKLALDWENTDRIISNLTLGKDVFTNTIIKVFSYYNGYKKKLNIFLRYFLDLRRKIYNKSLKNKIVYTSTDLNTFSKSPDWLNKLFCSDKDHS